MRHGSRQHQLLRSSALTAQCVLAWLVLLPPTAALALDAAAGSAHECLTAAQAQTEHHEGSHWLQAPSEEFFLAGDVRVHPYVLAQDDCAAFIAVGAKYVQDIDLRVNAEDGRTVARADGPSAKPYALYCGRAGDRVFVTLRVMDGQGEVSYAVLGHASEPMAALALLDGCPWIGEPRPAAIDVGPEPAARSIPEEMEHTRAALAPLGYKPGALLAYGTLAAGQHEARGMQLDAAHCYALVAVGSRDVVDLDLRMFGGPRLFAEPLMADTTRRRNAMVKLCASAPAHYIADVSVFQGAGAYSVQAFELQEPDARLPPGVDETARIAYAETARRMLQHGMHAQLLTTAIVSPAEILRLPLRLPEAACYAVAAVAVGETKPGALELGLTDERGELLATDAAAARAPLVYHCATAQQALQLSVRAREAHGASRLLVVLGRDAAAEQEHP
ncbi:MAG TPA: hypothetical protein VF331_18630 [Polyangiales bacterium]